MRINEVVERPADPILDGIVLARSTVTTRDPKALYTLAPLHYARSIL